MTTDPKLLPCPFCGGMPVQFVDARNGPAVVTFACTVCQASSGRRHSTADALDAWNRRPSPWIACDQRMPEPEDHVIVYTDNGQVHSDIVDKDTCDFLNYQTRDNTEQRFIDVGSFATHWMHERDLPLPPPPAPEGER